MVIPHYNLPSSLVKTEHASEERIKLNGFNNLTKILSFNLYDFCITLNDAQKDAYIQFINERYNAQKIIDVSNKICQIIEANILAISQQDYEPYGASTMVLMSDLKAPVAPPAAGGAQISCHLDKSHITAHTYPDTADTNGICTFRVDIDIATCGEIIPLSAINHLFEAFECDIVVMDYVVRGYTRLEDGTKIYNDQEIRSIKDFISPEILKNYKVCGEINLPNDNIWQTKLLIRDDVGPARFLLDPADIKNPEVEKKMHFLRQEMFQIFHQTN